MKTEHLRTVPMRKNIGNRRPKNRKCNLCSENFQCRTPFDRFCATCKKENELLKFGSCFPEIEDVIKQQSLIAS